MLIIEKKLDGANISSVQVKEFTEIDFNEVYLLFNEYKSKNIILNEHFDDLVWEVSNEKRIRKMDFGLNEIVFSQESKNRDIGLYIDLVNSLKTFVLYKLGSSAMETIYLIQIAIKNILEKTHYICLW